MKLDPYRKSWNQAQQALRDALSRPADHPKAVELFLGQHAKVHSSTITHSGVYSFDDGLWQDLTEPAARRIPAKCEHSIAWMIWHMARIEDMTMNVLLAGSGQVLNRDNWLERMNIAFCDTGNTMNGQEITKLSALIDIEALKAYRMTVGTRTRDIVMQLQPADTRRKVDAPSPPAAER